MSHTAPCRNVPAILAAVLLTAVGCGDEATTGPVKLVLDHFVASEPVVLHDIRYTNAAGNHYRIDDLRYYLSDVAFVRPDGSQHATSAAHLRDEAVPETREWTLDDVPYGDYTAVRFLFGLDDTHNRLDGLPSTTANLNMQWPGPLGGGYHYMQLDGAFDETTRVGAWQAHVGRLQRENVDPQPLETHFWVEFPLPLHVDGTVTVVQIRMDVNGWFASPNLYDFATYGGMVMNNPVAQQALSENGPHAFRLGSVMRAIP